MNADVLRAIIKRGFAAFILGALIVGAGGGFICGSFLLIAGSATKQVPVVARYQYFGDEVDRLWGLVPVVLGLAGGLFWCFSATTNAPESELEGFSLAHYMPLSKNITLGGLTGAFGAQVIIIGGCWARSSMLIPSGILDFLATSELITPGTVLVGAIFGGLLGYRKPVPAR